MKAAAATTPPPSPQSPSQQAPLYPTALNARVIQPPPSFFPLSQRKPPPLRSSAVLSPGLRRCSQPLVRFLRRTPPHIPPREENEAHNTEEGHTHREKEDRPT